MGHERRLEGDETWLTLREWLKGQKASERLAGAVLQSESYTAIDPSHPLGGPDGGKDILCRKDGLTFVGAVYFPRGQQTFKEIKDKYTNDLKGVEKHNADGFVFVTNQELRLGERKELAEIDKIITVDLYHLERLTQLLNVPKNYGIRHEYLDIDITKEEYLAFIASRDEDHYRRLQELEARLDGVLERIESQTSDLIGYTTGGTSIVFLEPRAFHHNRVDLYLRNRDKYPVFDVRVLYCDDDKPVDFKRGEPCSYHEIRLDVRTVDPNIDQPFPVQMFDMSKRDRLALTLMIQTRTARIFQGNRSPGFGLAGRRS